MIADLERLLAEGTEPERQAAALALADCPRPEAQASLAREPELGRAVREGRLAWPAIAAAQA